MTELNLLNSIPKQPHTSSPRFVQKRKRNENKKKRLSDALRENLRKRKEQIRARAR